MPDLKPRILTGLPEGTKERPRGDFRMAEFDRLFKTKGYELWWSRGGICPCELNDQTEQADPNCPLCRGKGFYYYLPDPAVTAGATEDKAGNPIELNDAGDAIGIQAIMTSMTQDVQIFEKFGEWVFGMCRVTTQWENHLAYGDRLISRRSIMPWNQVIVASGAAEIAVVGGESKAGLRYALAEIVSLRSVARAFRNGEDFDLSPEGTIRWLATPPVSGTRLSLGGFIHPVWIVQDFAHVYRDTLVQKKAASDRPEDQFQHMPIQTVAKLDFLIKP